ncbi:Nucleoid occlusion factor SlmA [Bibersteinia trehalosi USDA-ARS-USMARC-188]|uniref:Nucleoid occlusion factor SlmA n=4 Tax=Bibersteinia trehalosi TaxID=47735 RepID=W0R8X0_BIBTR|nr:nucleoid occlusion factor SlmA [Bibersteinia trehalosi]AGH39284.1 Nucleoid occlusion factor SlmA [Bibersteinia trehalosi USDA-ARS-USMARC-192]AHG80970.1 Nucleoid occlusion factor SlmA [Bibersteinia trehalosi USDA-ARS-USMARC-188]AHG83182.1 Nucleoid occlusion factor SlmA [Bibersteinia trehalosi USDA-ARS-USMARC-189]AHG87216.1 Nucleoid occlusion factor SlmA [Bibersteinia trehalosi USDA-ARS-USMARC-190]RRN01722.1 nucleoid occlusion factor SlmA [Bibersteinia trehalosi]
MVEISIKMPKRPVKERRQQVLEVLIKLLNSEDGMQRITTERLAKEVGVSEGALYRYFPSKTKMFEALIEQIEITLNSYVNAAKRQNSTAEAIKAILRSVIDFAQKNPGVTRILTSHALMFEDQMLKARVAKFFDGLELQFINILQMSKLREGKAFSDERALAGYLVNFCEGQFVRLVRSNFAFNPQQNFEKQWAYLKPLFY